MDTNWQPSEADMARGIVFETEQEASLWDAALAFTKILETSATDDVCLCGWKEVMIGDNPKRILGNTHPLCPCHSREGVLIAFVESLKTLPQWKVIFNPSDPDPNGVTLEVQSTAQGSTAKLPGLHPMDIPELLTDPEPTREIYPSDSIMHSRHGQGRYSECKSCRHEVNTGLRVQLASVGIYSGVLAYRSRELRYE